VIVTDAGVVAGEGRSRDGAGLHAETAALEAASDDARGATCYVSLEPCLKWCTPALIDAGIRRVVAATTDPNPQVNGRGVEALRAAGITVDVGLGEHEARALVEPFARWVRTGMPLVTLKLAASLDGKVAAPDGTSRWITGEAARAEVHDLRRRVDAVLVGSGTVLADDPALTFRTPGLEGKQPLRVVLDSSGRTPRDAQIFDAAAPSLVVTTEDSDVASGPDVVRVPRSEAGVDVRAALRALGERGICHVLVEGGPRIAASFAELGLVDRLVLYLAPKLIGGDAPGLFATGVKTLSEAWQLEIAAVDRVGDDVRIEARRMVS
jgi:diaminohydroxyphosphoribosylaminopyrimidine deaminase/5-amino-6-(5-phosphoribosylamino)uracil reductase